MRTRIVSMLLLAVGLPAPATGQELPSHALVPIDHWSMPFLEHMIARGVLHDPTPLDRPWQAGEIRQALLEADTTRMRDAERQMRRRLLSTFLAETDGTTVVAGGEGVVLASTHARRPKFSLRPEGPDRVTPQVAGLLALQFGPLALLMHPRLDANIDEDPDYAGIDQPIDGRFDEAYGALRTTYADVDLGNVSRNWGPTGLPGLLVSDWPLSYDHLFLRLGPRRIYLQMLVTQLDDAPNRQDELSKRFFVAHRLTARLVPWLTLAAWQATVYGGPNRSLEFWALNPFRAVFHGRDERARPSNVMLGGDGQLRLGRTHLSGSVLLDDFSRIFDDQEEPPSMAVTATATVPVGAVTLWAGYTLVTNLAYRAPDPAENPLIAINPRRGRAGTGLARNFSDYDQLTLRAAVVPLPGVLLTPELTLLRQGEGDPRLPFPPVAAFPDTPILHAGTVEHTWRAALLVAAALPWRVGIEGNVGVHRITNTGHVAGETTTDVVASATLRYHLSGAWPFN